MKRIKLNGKEYPVRMTMGALLRFKRETGKDVSEVKANDVADMVILMWCCVASACKADGIEFPLSLEEFADSLDPSSLQLLGDEVNSEAGDHDEKKSPGE